MNEIIFNTTLIRGAKGATGQGTSYEVPAGTIMAYDGNDIPEGWVETTAPEGMGGGDPLGILLIYNGTIEQCTDLMLQSSNPNIQNVTG